MSFINGKKMLCLLVLIVLVSAAAFTGCCGKDSGTEGIQTQLIGVGGTTIGSGDNVLFNSVLNDQSPHISYNAATGAFTIEKKGNYTVAWWFDTDGAGPAINVSFAVAVNGTPFSTASSPIVSGELSGNAFVTVETVPAVITLVNVTGEDVFIPSTPVQAGMVITN